jgi:hypothetical protein
LFAARCICFLNCHILNKPASVVVRWFSLRWTLTIQQLLSCHEMPFFVAIGRRFKTEPTCVKLCKSTIFLPADRHRILEIFPASPISVTYF